MGQLGCAAGSGIMTADRLAALLQAEAQDTAPALVALMGKARVLPSGMLVMGRSFAVALCLQ